MFWGSVTVSLKEKMAPGSVDNGLQESFHGLRVKGEACVWCGGVSGWLRWDEVIRLAMVNSKTRSFPSFARVVETGIKKRFFF